MKRKLLAILMAAAMIIAMLPVSAAALDTIQVNNASELAAALKGAGQAGAGNTTIEINADIDLTGFAWTPVNVDGYHGADIVTVNGNGHTITGLTAPLFSGGFAGGSGIVINDLTIVDSQIVSTNSQGSGAFIECTDSMSIVKLVNCHLLNSSLTGSRTGGLVGWTAGYNKVNDGPVKSYITFENCSVIGCTITGYGSVGGLNGHAGANAWTYTTISNCTVANNTLTAYDSGNYRIGVLIGTANVGEVTVGTVTVGGNVLKQYTAPNGSEVVRPEGQSDLYGRVSLGTTGKYNPPAENQILPYGPAVEEKQPINFFLYFFMKQFLTEYEIAVVTEGNGSVVSSDDDGLVCYSDEITFTAVPGEGSELTSILIDGVEAELSADNVYTIDKVKSAHTVTFIFSEAVQEIAE